MAEENDILTGIKRDDTQSHALKVKVSMQQGEHTGQPIYSNLTSAQRGQGVVLVDFGFLDPQATLALNRIVISGEKMSNTINARMSCRMAISIDAANQLSQQLNQLLDQKMDLQGRVDQRNTSDMSKETTSSRVTVAAESGKSESVKSGFRLPWSKKTH